MRRSLIAIAFVLVVGFGALTVVSRDAEPAHAAPAQFWVNSLTYGSAGGGFWWDPVSGQVWTTERGWHVYSPTQPTGLLWIDYGPYGAGGGFYLDGGSGLVWTSERGWHVFRELPAVVVPTPTTTPLPEVVGVVKVIDISQAIIARQYGLWRISYGPGCIRLWQYEGRTVYLTGAFGALLIGIGARLVLPLGDSCQIYGSELLQ